jgi:transposase
MLRALIEGEESPVEMAQHARGRMRRKQAALAVARSGSFDEHRRFLLRLQLQRIEAAEADLERLDARLREKLAPYAEPLRRLMRIPGVDWIIAATIIAEIGVDMSAFVGADHLTSWTGICPGHHRSAGKQRSGKTRKGNVYLKTALVTAAIGASKTRGCHLREKHRRLRARRGEMRAHVAIAHKILVAAYHILARGSDYQDLGPAYLDQIDQRHTAARLTRRLRDLGYDVQITPKAA